jgi:hypothetical protein
MGLLDDKREDKALERIAGAFEALTHQVHFFNQHLFATFDFKLAQSKGEFMGAIVGVPVGSSDVFTALLVPANSVPLQSGPVFSTDDSLVTLTPDPTNAFKTTAAVGAGDTAASFNLKVDGVNGAGNPITHTFVIPILAAPPVQAVDFDLSQGA